MARGTTGAPRSTPGPGVPARGGDTGTDQAYPGRDGPGLSGPGRTGPIRAGTDRAYPGRDGQATSLVETGPGRPGPGGTDRPEGRERRRGWVGWSPGSSGGRARYPEGGSVADGT